jgi:uncharacterized protein (TIGR01244 family)
MSLEEIYNFKRIDERVVTGGQPTEAQLQDAAAAGIGLVINLATDNPRYSLPDEAGLVAALGMRYVAIPVAWEAPQQADFAAFEQVMQTAVSTQKILIHCAANYRVTAFYALYARKHLGWSADAAADLMSYVWQPGEYPVWDEFVQAITEEIQTQM